MVIVIVAEQDDIDLRQVLESHAGFARSLGTDPTEWACSLRPNRISQDVDAARLNQKSRMIDESNRNLIRVERLVQPMHALILDPSRPPATRLARHLQGVTSGRRITLRQSRVEEAIAIEVIGERYFCHVILM